MPGVTEPPACPWTKGALHRLSEALREDRDPPADGPSLEDALTWYGRYAVWGESVLRAVNWRQVLGRRIRVDVTSRAKSLDTMFEKIRGDFSRTGIPLDSIRDMAGVRMVARMTTTEQDLVASHLANVISESYEGRVKKPIDRRRNPVSGYRAVHLEIVIGKIPIEVQIRTELQALWANLYEGIADAWGREIRYGQIPLNPGRAELIKTLQVTSTVIIAEFESVEADLDAIDERARDLPLSDRLPAWRPRRIARRRIERVRDELVVGLGEIDKKYRTL